MKTKIFYPPVLAASISLMLLAVSCSSIDSNDSIFSMDNDKVATQTSTQVENDLSENSGLYLFEIKVKTPEIMARQELKNEMFNEELYEKTLTYFQSMYYFTFSIRRTDSNQDIVKCYSDKEEERNKIISYLSFEMQGNCSLITEKDTIPCRMYHYERNYGVSPFTDISLAFEKTGESGKVLAFLYHDTTFGNKDLLFDLKNYLE